MKRYFHLVLISVCVFMMTALLFLAAGSLSPPYSTGATIKVPGDYDTIQAAVDAAADGDTIMVASDKWNPDIGEGSNHFNGVFAIDRDHIWLARDSGGILYSTDGGDNYEKQQSGFPGEEMMRVSAVDQQTAWVVSPIFGGGNTGHVLHTVDAGQTWINQDIPVITAWGGVSFVR